jgi:hypothetical protein
MVKISKSIKNIPKYYKYPMPRLKSGSRSSNLTFFGLNMGPLRGLLLKKKATNMGASLTLAAAQQHVNCSRSLHCASLFKMPLNAACTKKKLNLRHIMLQSLGSPSNLKNLMAKY